MRELETFALKLTKKLGLEYTLRSKSITPAEVFSCTGLLPALIKRTDQLSSLCFGVVSGVTYKDNKESLLGTEVVFGQKKTIPLFFYYCFSDTLIEVTRSAKHTRVSLDELLYD